MRKFTRMMGLQPGFTADQLRRAYLVGCRKLAPDKGGDHRRFTALQEAHGVLKRYAQREEVDLANKIPARPMPESLTAAPTQGPRHKDANSAFAALYGNTGPTLRGHGDWLKQDVPSEHRPPDHVSAARLNETFERLAKARGRGPQAVSTHVVQPVAAFSSVGFDIDDSADDFTFGCLADLQRAYGGAL